MKIVFIASGYSGIYPYFEQSILHAFSQLNHQVLQISPNFNLQTTQQIEQYHPDFVLSFVGYKLEQPFIQFLKQKGYVLGVWLTEDPFYIDESVRLAEAFDLIFTIDLGAFEYYQQTLPAKSTYHLPLGADPKLYSPPDIQGKNYFDICLIGYPYPERIELARHILEHTSYTMIIAGPLWKKFIGSEHFKRLKLINKWVEPTMVKDIIHSSKIILNPHRSYNYHQNKNTLGIASKSINNRTFDIAACNGFQLCSSKPDLALHFDPLSEVIPYTTNEECIKYIHQFVHDETTRNQFSYKAKERVLTNHTFMHRIQFILKTIIK
ncbi:protein CgeB [Bacillus sp. S3]|uniref:CgeB family protein n=1 Tax=Bacillus sp. S3 TaxID=486398 RepID=UPI001188EE62|nr:glycosyltransferase [Bacillus sp. S3]QCJ40995.1 protein CgeB [Bacillus sp. S3]